MSVSGEAVLMADVSTIRRDFNRMPFALKHSLAESGLFSLDALAQCAEALLRSGRDFRFHIRDAQGDLAAKFPKKSRTLVTDVFKGLERSNSWVKLNNVGDIDDRYQALVDRLIDDLERLTDLQIRQQVTLAQLTVFIASPQSVTPYHIDHECNFLCQVSGLKDVCVFDPNDRDLVSHRMIERFYTGDLNSAMYRSELQPRGLTFRIGPGDAVHHPPLAPHWVRTLDEVAVSVSFNLCMRPLEDRAFVYQVNHLLRMLKLEPRPPGASPRADRAKAAFMRAFATRHPKTAAEVVNSGLMRLRAPLYKARDLGARLAGRHAQDQ